MSPPTEAAAATGAAATGAAALPWAVSTSVWRIDELATAVRLALDAESTLARPPRGPRSSDDRRAPDHRPLDPTENRPAGRGEDHQEVVP